MRRRNHSRRGIMATVLGAVSLIILAALLVISFYTGGEGNLVTGAIGTSGFLIALVGLIIGLGSFRGDYRSYLFCRLGSILSGLTLAVWLLVLAVGIGMSLQ